MPAETLPVVDLVGVEIAAADVTVHGGGSPTAGDTYSRDDLMQIAADSNEVASDLRAPVKIGHAKDQKLLRASGLWGEQPRTGTLTNFRVTDDKLICDVKAMPQKLAEVAKTAFRLRSMELGPAKSQRTKKSYPRVVKGLALLGASTPAFQTLDDIRALYSESVEPDDHAAFHEVDTQTLYFQDQPADFDEEPDLRVTDYAVGDVVWDSEEGVQDKMQDVAAQINPPDGMESRYWVMDLIDGPDPRALVGEYGSGRAWVVPLTYGSDGEPVVPPSADWVLAEQAWVQVAPAAGDAETSDSGDTSMAETRETATAADTRNQMAAETITDTRPELDEAQVKHFAAALGLGDDATSETVYEALDAKIAAAEAPAPAPAEEPGTRTMSDQEYDTMREMAERGAAAAETLRTRDRDALITGAVKAGKIDPSQVTTYAERYDHDAQFTAAVINDLPVNPDWLRIYGSDADGLDNAGVNQAEELQYQEYCANQGITYIPLGRAA